MLLAASSISYCLNPDSNMDTHFAYSTICSDHLCTLVAIPETACVCVCAYVCACMCEGGEKSEERLISFLLPGP